MVIYAYNHHVWLLPPGPWSSTKVYSGRGSQHCYEIKSRTRTSNDCPVAARNLRQPRNLSFRKVALGNSILLFLVPQIREQLDRGWAILRHLSALIRSVVTNPSRRGKARLRNDWGGKLSGKEREPILQYLFKSIFRGDLAFGISYSLSNLLDTLALTTSCRREEALVIVYARS